jgi:hypothetical protein
MDVMKKLLLYYATIVFIAILYISCKKNDTIVPLPDFNNSNKGCLVTNTSDLSGFGAYDLAFTYNARGNPETFAGFLQISYDNKGRLLRQQNDGDNYVQWEYDDDNTFLPAFSYNYANGIRTGTQFFTYDEQGRMVKSDRIYVNNYAQGEVIWEYTYDIKGNVQTIMQKGETVPLFKAISYDDKPNSTGANQWIKYILNDPGSGYLALNYLLFSANNATEWSLADNFFATAPTVNCYYTYNAGGSVTRDSVVFHDPVNGEFYDIQTNSFNCP